MSTWKIDPTHTDILLSAKHMMVTNVRGKFDAVDGTFEIDEADPTRSTGRFSVKAASIDTGVERRDDHLRSTDFLDVEHHPEITFTSTRIESKGGDRYAVTGDLTVRGITKPATFDVEVLGFYASMQGGRRVGLTAKAKLQREDWGLTWNIALESGGVLVGKEIKLEIEIAADEVAVPARVAASSAA